MYVLNLVVFILTKVPLGTVVKEEGCVIADLAAEGAEFVIAEGGEGGKGNVWFTTPEDRASKESTEGSQGQERTLEVELRTIADVGMVNNIILMINYIQSL